MALSITGLAEIGTSGDQTMASTWGIAAVDEDGFLQLTDRLSGLSKAWDFGTGSTLCTTP